MTIATRLFWFFMLVAVLPLLLFGYVNLREYETVLRDETLERLDGLADKKLIQIKDYLKERQQDVMIRARGPQVGEGIDHLAALYAQGGTGSAAYRAAAAELHRYFSRYVEESHQFYDVFLITPDGEIVYTQKQETDLASNLMSGAYRDTQLAQAFRSVRMTLEPVISGYELYTPSQQPALFIAAPILVEGRLRGVFAVQLGNALLYRVATDATGLGNTGEASFAQWDGDQVRYTTPLKYRSDAALQLRRDRQAFEHSAMFEALSGNAGAGVIRDYRDLPVVAAWRYLPELHWGMVVKIDVEEEYLPLYQQRQRLLGMLAAMLMGIGLLASYLGRQISRLLTRLAQSADRIAEGDLTQRVEENAPGELGRFAHAFNHMADHLRQLYQSLETRVEQRTEALNLANERLQQEVAERQRTATELAQREEFLRTIIETEPECVKVIARNGELLQMNATGLAMLEASTLAEVQQHTPLGFVLPEYRDAFIALHQQVMAGEEGELQFEVIGLRGTRRWLEMRAAPMWDAKGRVTMLLGITRDITALKQSLDALRIAAVAFETHEGIMITDAAANIIRVNRAFSEITGYAAADVLGQNPRILSSGRHGAEFYAAMWQQLKAAGVWSGEIWDKRKNGEVYPKWLTISAVKDEAGQITGYVAIFGDITARKRAEEEIRNLAFYDALTGLPNRRLLTDRCQQALSVSARSHQCGALLFLDMDKFKSLNDTLGHDFGDLMLIEVGRRLQICVREVDTVARLGGDEFVVLLEEISHSMDETSQKVAFIAEKIRAQLAQPYMLGSHEIHSSPSIGVSLYRGTESSLDTLMKQADLAMYQAKEGGRNAVRFFDPAMQQKVEVHAQLEADLRRALPKRQLQLYFQLQVDREQRAIGAEALIRWLHPERGLVSPAQFIPVAEESALIQEVGSWAIEEACRQLARWAEVPALKSLLLAVNVSAHQFRRPDFVSKLADVIAHFDIDPTRLKLELTESVVLDNVADVVAKMHAIKALGVRLSLDDFGTGYSSLAYLKQLPLDQLKIDQSFVRDISSDPNDAVMVKTIIDMALNFRLNVIAEGVETPGQLAFLKENGCLAYQGYLFSKPLPVEQFEQLVRGEG